MKKILILFLITLTYLFSSNLVFAADLEVSCNSSSCSSNPSNGSIFNETNILPTNTFARTLKAANTSADALNFAIEVVNPYKTNTSPSLANVISITITETESASVVYGPKTINQWQTDGFIVLSNIPAGQERNYLFNATFANVGNEYQSKELIFDINLGFDALPQNYSNGGEVNGSSDGGDGRQVCNSSSPLTAPSLTAIQGSANTVLLSWSAVTPATHYMIQYGVNSGEYIYGASNVGNVTSFVVSGLSAGQTYYFRVAGINDCMPGPWSNEANTSTFGTIFEQAPAPGFQVLGANEDLTPTPTITGQELGTADTSCLDTYYYWWLPLIFQALLIVTYLVLIGNKKHRRYFWILPTIISLISQIIHYLLGCNCATGKWCPWYWLLNLLILLILLTIYYLNKSRHS